MILAGADDKSSAGDCSAELPGFDPAGLDTEDVQPIRSGLYIACDEYGKVIVFDSKGEIKVTYVPGGQGTLITKARSPGPLASPPGTGTIV
jgi:hypothetical protein